MRLENGCLIDRDRPRVHEDHFPVGVAIDERETLGSTADLTTLHFNQVTDNGVSNHVTGWKLGQCRRM